MFEGMKVVSKGDIAVGLMCAAVVGAVIAITTIEQIERHAAHRASAQIRPLPAPQVVRRDALETVAKFSTRIDGRRMDCTVTLDHKLRSWSLSC